MKSILFSYCNWEWKYWPGHKFSVKKLSAGPNENLNVPKKIMLSVGRIFLSDISVQVGTLPRNWEPTLFFKISYFARNKKKSIQKAVIPSYPTKTAVLKVFATFSLFFQWKLIGKLGIFSRYLFVPPLWPPVHTKRDFSVLLILPSTNPKQQRK